MVENGKNYEVIFKRFLKQQEIESAKSLYLCSIR